MMMLSALIKKKFPFDFNVVCLHRQYGAAFIGTFSPCLYC